MNGAVLVAALLGLAAAAIAAVALDRQNRERGSDLVHLRLRFGRDLEPAAIERFLSSLIGLRPPAWRRWLYLPVVTFEVRAGLRSIEHRLIVSARLRGFIERQLRTHLPTVRVDVIDVEAPVRLTSAAEYRATSTVRVLRVDPEVLSSTLLSSLTPLGRGQRVLIQLLVAPAGPPAVPHLRPPTSGLASDWLRTRSGEVTSTDEVSALREKQRLPIFLTSLRIGVSSPDGRSDRGLLRRVEAGLHTTAAPGVHLRRRRTPARLVLSRIVKRRAPRSAWPIECNARELSGLVTWPIGGVSLPGLEMSGCRPLPVPEAVPPDGTVIGVGTTNGRERAAALTLAARLRHSWIAGPTGTGKSTLMVRMIGQDVRAGFGVVALDPKGTDLVDEVAARMPPEVLDRVAVLDPTDPNPLSVDPLRPHGVDRDLAVEQLVGLLHRLFHATWGIRSADLFNAALRTVVLDDEASLADVIPLLTNPAARRRYVDRVTDPVLAAFWHSFNGLSESEQANHAAPVLNKLRSILSRPGLRRTFCDPHPRFNFVRHLNSGGVVLLPVNGGLLGEDAAAMFSAVVLGLVWNTIQARAAVPADRRHPLMLYLDELSAFASLPVPLEELLSRARSYGVGATLGFQHFGQFSSDLRGTLLANPRTRICLGAGGADARLVAAEFGAGLTQEDVQGLAAHEAVAQLFAAGRTQPACTLTTSPPDAPTTDPREVRRHSTSRWGCDGKAVDAAIAERLRRDHGSAAWLGSEVPTGRRRRRSS